MARTTRKAETGTTAAKPTSRRRTAASPADGAGKATTRRRTKIDPDVAPPPAIADDRPARADRPLGAVTAPEPNHQQIAVRAYDIFLRRGATHGYAARDWFQARAELLQERGVKP